MRCAECEYIPSLHLAIAPFASVSSGLPEPPVSLDELEDELSDFVVDRTRSDGGAGAAVAAGLIAGGRAAGVDGAGAAAGVGAIGAAAEAFAAKPPCLEQAPRPPLDMVPSVQLTIAFAFIALCAAFVAFLSTPPWPEQAPRPVVADEEPSVHTEPIAWAEACVDSVQSAAIAAEVKRIRMRIICLRD